MFLFRSDVVFTYNPNKSTVDYKSPLQEYRSSCGVEVVCHQLLYAVGGRYGQEYLKSVERCRPGIYNYFCYMEGVSYSF